MAYPAIFGFWILFPLGLLFWVLVIGLLVRFVRGGRRGWGPGWHGYGSGWRHHAVGPPWFGAEDPMVILRTRLARGEVTEEEHERLKAALER